jgi:hypothetical protein
MWRVTRSAKPRHHTSDPDVSQETLTDRAYIKLEDLIESLNLAVQTVCY